MTTTIEGLIEHQKQFLRLLQDLREIVSNNRKEELEADIRLTETTIQQLEGIREERLKIWRTA